MPVRAFVTVTVAPGTIAPSASVTLPPILPTACPKAAAVHKKVMIDMKNEVRMQDIYNSRACHRACTYTTTLPNQEGPIRSNFPGNIEID